MQVKQTLNGIDTEKLFTVIDGMKTDPKLADFRFRAHNRWIDGSHNRTTIQKFEVAGQEDATRTKPFVLDAGEPAVLLGQDQGPNPVEYLLAGLAGCITTALVAHAAARGIPLEEVESTLEGHIDMRGWLGISEDVRNGYDGIQVNLRIKADVPDETIQELVAMGQKYSPVFDVVSNGTRVLVTGERK